MSFLCHPRRFYADVTANFPTKSTMRKIKVLIFRSMTELILDFDQLTDRHASSWTWLSGTKRVSTEHARWPLHTDLGSTLEKSHSYTEASEFDIFKFSQSDPFSRTARVILNSFAAITERVYFSVTIWFSNMWNYQTCKQLIDWLSRQGALSAVVILTLTLHR